MSEIDRSESPCQRLKFEARAWGLSPHDYLDALDEAVICLRTFGGDDGWREGDREKMLRRLLRARAIAEEEGADWVEYKKALGLDK